MFPMAIDESSLLVYKSRVQSENKILFMKQNVKSSLLNSLVAIKFSGEKTPLAQWFINSAIQLTIYRSYSSCKCTLG